MRRPLAEGKVIGWFQGRMEMGPRALGARSILADPRSAEVRDRINCMVKRREPFRPFAPSVLADRAGDYFQLGSAGAAPYMLVTFETHKPSRAQIPAVVHVDGSSRIQTVSADANPRYHSLLERFHQQTGVPVLLNTSFNQAGEPIVNSPDDAVRCFLRSGLDALAVGDYLVFPDHGG
jgi:carbamoyltransferase